METLSNIFQQLSHLVNNISVTVDISAVLDIIQENELVIRQQGIYAVDLTILPIMARIENECGIYETHLISKAILEILVLTRIGQVDFELLNNWVLRL